MKKQVMTMFVMMNLMVGCGQKDSSSQLEAAKAGTTYIATVKQVNQTSACAKRVSAIAGVTLGKVLSEIGVISFNSDKSTRDKVAVLSCISSVEKEASAYIWFF